jgi:hypothetical protein
MKMQRVFSSLVNSLAHGPNSMVSSPVLTSFSQFVDTPEKYQNRQSIVSLNKGVVGHMEQKKVNVDKMHNPLKYKPTSEEIPLTIPFHNKEQPSNLMIWYVIS